MSRFKTLVWIGFTALIFVPIGAFAIVTGIEDTLPPRTVRLDADLRAKVPPGRRPEQLRTWLVANGFECPSDFDRRVMEPPHSVVVWIDDPAWFSSARFWIEVRFDEQGRVLSSSIVSSRVSL